MNTCQNCSHWIEEQRKRRDGARKCVNFGSADEPVNSDEAAVAVYVADDTGLEFGVYTGKDFYCNQHKRK